MHTITTHSIEQRSLDWYRARLGKITGSQVGEIFGKGRAKDDIFSKTALSYLTAIAAERMLPDYIVNDDEIFTVYLDEVNMSTKAMRIGTEREADARSLYAEITGCYVEECSCIPHPIYNGFASSPDGLVKSSKYGNLEGVIEVKCPKPSTFMEYLSSVRSAENLKAINAIYYWQCISHIAVTGAPWCDFIIYCPYISTPLHIVRIYSDDNAIAQLYDRLTLAFDKINFIVENSSTAIIPISCKN